jgi:hypothetical protein
MSSNHNTDNVPYTTNNTVYSKSLCDLADEGLGGKEYQNLLDKCEMQGFNLDNFLFEIWTETKDND